MPNDLYMWEEGGGLIHHCPMCYKPLTTPQARSRCLGEHVEWCKLYHTQLFKKGMSGECRPCRQTNEEHYKRHREIAERVEEVKQLKAESQQSPTTPLTPRGLNILQHHNPASAGSPVSKREKKATKKLKKVADMVASVTSADVEFVAQVLHPYQHEDGEDVDIETKMREDKDVKSNVFFHKGTGNVREIRNHFFTHGRHGLSGTTTVSAVEIDGVLQLLNISPITNSTSSEEKAAIAALRKKIEEDLLQVQNEHEQMLMRKAGFWRWASKKAYKRLLANGKIWSEKGQDILKDVKAEDTSADSASSTGLLDTDTDITEPDTEPSTPVGSKAKASDGSTNTKSTASRSNTADLSPGDGGWSTVPVSSKGKKKKASPSLKIKLISNGGLINLVQSVTPKSAVLEFLDANR